MDERRTKDRPPGRGGDTHLPASESDEARAPEKETGRPGDSFGNIPPPD
ncbi:MAG: hypothetical protein M3N07_09710 [Pseudomonadota bacterium]|nr:hypothetical protein [Pseudomonadota bacterium]